MGKDQANMLSNWNLTHPQPHTHAHTQRERERETCHMNRCEKWKCMISCELCDSTASVWLVHY